MKRIYQSCVCAGLVVCGLIHAGAAHGQATATEQGQVVPPMRQGRSTFPASKAVGAAGMPAGSRFPRGYQIPTAMTAQPMAVQASSQLGMSSSIPSPRRLSTFPTGHRGLTVESGASTPNPYFRPEATPRVGALYPSAQEPTNADGFTRNQIVPFSSGTSAYNLPTSKSGQEGPSGQAGIPIPGRNGGLGAGPGGGAEGMPGAIPGEEAGIPALPRPGEGPEVSRLPGALGEGGAMGTEAGAEGAGVGMPPAEPGAGSEAAPPISELDEGAAEINIAGLGGQVGATAGPAFAPNMIGDLSPFYAQPAATRSPLPVPGPKGSALPYPSLRNFKVSENQSPRPQDRFFFDFNFYTNVNSTVNSAERSPINRMNAYVYMWGFEKTFDEGRGSVGMRLPLNTMTARSVNNTVATPTSTALGNLDIFIKYILKENVETGSLITAGFQITPPTATSRFAGAPYVYGLNTTYFQPFVAYIWQADRFYLQGFSGFDFPSNNADVTLVYNDIGVGYFLYRSMDSNRFITGVAPTFEVHVNTPINHRNPYNVYDPAASMYVTNLTYGLNVMMFNRSMLTAALVTPLTNPKPYDTEFALLLNVFFGRTVRSPQRIIPPVIQ